MAELGVHHFGAADLAAEGGFVEEGVWAFSVRRRSP
jgi:hypothetical protein